MDVYAKTQAELDVIPLDTKDLICINFGTKEKPAIVREKYCYSIRIINNSVVATYNNSKTCTYHNSKICAYDNSKVWARDNSIICAYDNSKVFAHHNGKIRACDNSIICAYDDSQVAAYDNSKVWAYKDKCIVSINDNAIVISPSIFCSGAELLNQCNGYIDDVKFAISNVPDEKKDYVFGNYCCTDDFSKRVFILTMRDISYYCVYDFDTMSVKFYTMDFCRTFGGINKNKIFTYYLDNILMPALVNTRFDKNVKSNII